MNIPPTVRSSIRTPGLYVISLLDFYLFQHHLVLDHVGGGEVSVADDVDLLHPVLLRQLVELRTGERKRVRKRETTSEG